jgi:subtilisin family serine protease
MRRGIPAVVAVALTVATLVAIPSHAGARALPGHSEPAFGRPPGDRFTATPLTPTGRVTGSKSSRLATTDPDLLASTGSRPVPVVVKLNHDALATYDGDVAGIPATSPAVTGRPLSGGPAERAYLRHVAKRERTFIDRLLRDVPQARVGRRLRTVYGGVAVTVPADALADVVAIPGVVAVQRDSLRRPLTDASSEFTGASRLYPGQGGTARAGAGVIVGVLDSGVWPEHPSFADSAGLGAPPPRADGRSRVCDLGDNPLTPASDVFACNNKLIGAAPFLSTYLSHPDLAAAERYHTARDSDGHGTHTASTAVGNRLTSARVLGVQRGSINGMAPGAWLSVYKVCGAAGCFSSDSAAAVEQAILDGVDVINFSISGGTDPYTDPVELAFLDAYAAGVFVATSAGNDGPDAGTVNHLSPWVTTTAASTQARTFESTLTLTAADGASLTLRGASVTAGAGPRPVVLASAAPYSDRDCLAPAAAGTLTGVIVVCRRGTNPRVEKGYNVGQGGAAGMILYNPSLADIETDNHWLPTVHLPDARLLDFLAAHAGVSASFTPGRRIVGRGDVLAAFSSRGPGGQFMKPDLAAPGVQILAGHTPTPDSAAGGPPGEYFQVIAGTSMAAPHVAGAAALLMATHPQWTPGQVRSALVTTAKTGLVTEDLATRAGADAAGAGRIRPARAANPGLTFDESAATMALRADDPVRAVHLNLPSVNAPVMPGRLSTTRVATNVTGRTQTYVVRTSAVDGDSITVSPARFTVGAGRSVRLRITIESLGPTRAHAGAVLLDAVRPGLPTLRLPVSFVPRQGEVSLASSCTPAAIAWLARTRCQVTATNGSPVDTMVNLRSDTALPLMVRSTAGADRVTPFGVVAEDVPLAGTRPATPSLRSGQTPAGPGYLPMSSFGSPLPIGDDEIVNFSVPAFVLGGRSYDVIGVDSNGYIVVGGGGSDDDVCCDIRLPDPTRPNNVLAPFWTDLDGTGAPGIYGLALTDGVRTWIVIEWDVRVYGSTSPRHFQVWIGVNGTEDVSYDYDPAALPADPARPFVVGAENADGSGGHVLAGLPTDDLVVVTSPPTPGESFSYTVDLVGALPGRGTLISSMRTAIVGGTTVVRSGIDVTDPSGLTWP